MKEPTYRELIRDIKDSLVHLLFPHLCSGCGTDILSRESMICMRCMSELPATNFHSYPDNPVEKIFWGRLSLISATALYYFTKESTIQHLMHDLKYKGNQQLGKQLGMFLGMALESSDRFKGIDALIPMPLFPAREKKRGFNQATVLCEGISEILNIEILKQVIVRNQHTETQTKKGRNARWENIEGKFTLINPDQISCRHVLLVDDVVTTGASLEACGRELLKPGNTQLSVATLCYTY